MAKSLKQKLDDGGTFVAQTEEEYYAEEDERQARMAKFVRDSGMLIKGGGRLPELAEDGSYAVKEDDDADKSIERKIAAGEGEGC